MMACDDVLWLKVETSMSRSTLGLNVGGSLVGKL